MAHPLAVMWIKELSPEMKVVWDGLPRRVQENMCFEARGMAKTLEELLRDGVHKIWLDMMPKRKKK